MQDSSIEILKIDISDIETLQSLSIQTFYETYSDRNTPENMEIYVSKNFSSEKLKKDIEQKDSEIYFALMDKTPVGYLKVNYNDIQTELNYPNSIELERIYVLKEHQGHKIGQLLFNKALSLGKQKNMNFLWLGVWSQNTKAIHFYEKNGLKKFRTHLFKLGEDKQLDFLMKIDI